MTRVWTSPPSSPMATSDHAYGVAFDQAFQSAASTLGQGEIPLFRAFADALCHASGGFHVEEYHGAAHQVEFIGNGTHSRPAARCELSDLLILVFLPFAGVARYTYLQAKSERGLVTAPNTQSFKANLEQWDLLSRRPVVQGYGRFDPPPGLLSSASLASIGSFGIFYRPTPRVTQVVYAAGDCLIPTAIHSRRQGKVALSGSSMIRKVNGLPERTFLTTNYEFARDLFGLKIGEPLLLRGTPSDTPGGRWMAGILRSMTRGHERPGSNRPLLLELATRLGGTQGLPTNDAFGAKRLIIIRSDCNPLDEVEHQVTPEPSPEPEPNIQTPMYIMRQG